jgi:UDP-2,3-diacylglucosamine hydrolase
LRVIIASDFHLCFRDNTPERRQRTERVIQFLDSLRGKTDLLILAGDIFDLWMEWSKTLIKGYFPILKKLADLREDGCRIVLIAGNHDFWFGYFLRDFLNIEVVSDIFRETIDTKKIFVTHGDKQTVNDLRYKIFRTIIRSPITKSLLSLIHPEIALNIGGLLSRTSRARSVPTNGQKNRSAGLEQFASKNAKRYDIIVMGHAHTPAHKIFDGCQYFNTGDWITHYSYIELIDGRAELLYFGES